MVRDELQQVVENSVNFNSPKIKLLAFRPFTYPDDGPGTNRMRSFIRELGLLGFDVTYVAIAASGANVDRIVEQERQFGIRLILLPPPSFIGGALGMKVERILGVHLFPSWQNYRSENVVVESALTRLLDSEQFDCILSTYVPMGALSIASRISRKYRTPWVADLRDIPDELDIHRRKRISRVHALKLAAICKTASAVVTVSPALVEGLRNRYGLSDAQVVYNGFEDTKQMKPHDDVQAEFFVIRYSGSISAGRTPDLLFAGLDLLSRQNVDLSNVVVSVCGSAADIRHLNCSRQWKSFSMVRFDGIIPRKSMLRMQRESAILLSLASPNARGILTSKIFEYSVTGRPVLSIPPDHDALDEFIQNARIGESCGKAEEVARFIQGHIRSWRETGKLPRVNPDLKYLSQFSRKAQALKLAEIIKSLLGGQMR